MRQQHKFMCPATAKIMHDTFASALTTIADVATRGLSASVDIYTCYFCCNFHIGRASRKKKKQKNRESWWVPSRIAARMGDRIVIGCGEKA